MWILKRDENGFDTYDHFENDRNPTEVSRDAESVEKDMGDLHETKEPIAQSFSSES